MSKFMVAFATDDGKAFNTRHFGDSKRFHLYEIDEDQATMLAIIENSSEEEEIHADPKKAKGVSQLLLKENVTIVVSKVFGPNIKRIKKKFVCIKLETLEVQEGINIIQKNLKPIQILWNKGSERNHLNL